MLRLVLRSVGRPMNECINFSFYDTVIRLEVGRAWSRTWFTVKNEKT